MNFASQTIMPLLARLVIAGAMLTSGWLNCFGQVQIRPGIVDGLRAMDIEVRPPKVEAPKVEASEGETPDVKAPQVETTLMGDKGVDSQASAETPEPVKPAVTKHTTRGVNRIVWLMHDTWPNLGGWGTFIAWAAAIAQLIAGVLLFVGLFTRWAACAVCIATGMAIYIVSGSVHGMFTMNPFDWPHDSHRFIQLFAGLGLFTLSLWLVFGGGGGFSIDQHHGRSPKSPKSNSRKNSIE